MDWPTVAVSIAGNVAVAGVAIWALRAQAENAERQIIAVDVAIVSGLVMLALLVYAAWERLRR